MRARSAGFIGNLSSAGGFVTYPAVGYYHMVKFAIEALSETLAKEVGPLGIGVMAVEPAPFRTGFRSSSSLKQSKNRIDAYLRTRPAAPETKLLRVMVIQNAEPERLSPHSNLIIHPCISSLAAKPPISSGKK